MRAELMNCEVLAMYDIRGIQNYIFKSNDLQEIIGASNLVENIIVDGLRKITRTNGNWNQEEFLIDWENDKGTEFLNDNQIKMQVLFIGGGNAYVLFRTGALCSEINKKLAKFVLDSTYSLNLAVAVVKKTQSYKQDYNDINVEMRRIKAEMPETKPTGFMPFMKSDPITGYPLTVFRGRKFMEYKDGKREYLCTEAWLKRDSFPKEESPEKILDNMVTGKGDNSTLALVHIDGNNMGQRLMHIMEKKETYPEAVQTMRAISMNIDNGFSEAYKACEQYVESKADFIKPDRKGKLIRGIIRAGDDITFICNVKAALGAVEAFIRETSCHLLYQEAGLTEKENLQKYGLSACGGIAYFNSHFPFRDAYEIAESCCESAKKRAKSKDCRQAGQANGNMGSFWDFQICMNVNAGNLKEYRKKQYQIAGQSGSIIKRPYYVPCPLLDEIGDLNHRNAELSLEILKSNIAFFADTKRIPRSQAKKLRNSFSYGYGEVEKYITFLKSRQRLLPDTEQNSWYDALEIMDYAVMKGGELICV